MCVCVCACVCVCVCVCVCLWALCMFGARPFPASERVLARLSRRSAGNLGRGPGCGAGWVVDCVLFYFVLLWFRSLFSFFVVVFSWAISEGCGEFEVHEKNPPAPLVFGCGLDGERDVVDLGFFGLLLLSARPRPEQPSVPCPLPGLLGCWVVLMMC